VRAGEPLSRDNIWVKRPGTGPLKAWDFERVLGRVAARDLPEHSQLAESDLAPAGGA
jgi:N-acetylneuraminate synthase